VSGVAIFPKTVSQKTVRKKWFDTAFRGQIQSSSEITKGVGTQGPNIYQIILAKYIIILMILRSKLTV